MSDLLRPGAWRADGIFDDDALLAATLRVEQEWLVALAGAGIAPRAAVVDLADAVVVADLAGGSDGGSGDVGEGAGNPVVPLVALLRRRLGERGDADAARWVHRGLTSQDVLDTALVLCVRDGLDRLITHTAEQVTALLALLDAHADTALAGRTLTQHAVPITAGVKIAGWLDGVLDAAADAVAVRAGLPVQQGGAAGTRAASVELARRAGMDRAEQVARELAAALAHALGLAPRRPWHTARLPVTRAGDALVAMVDACARIANDVATLSRPEIGELAEGRGGGSSTMPGKANPVLATLVRAAALSAPMLAATLHLAAARMQDERPAGAWHAEWPALRALTRTAVVAASQTADLLSALRVDDGRMAANAHSAAAALSAERAGLRAALADPAAPESGAADGGVLSGYLGDAAGIVEAARRRAGAFLEGRP